MFALVSIIALSRTLSSRNILRPTQGVPPMVPRGLREAMVAELSKVPKTPNRPPAASLGLFLVFP